MANLSNANREYKRKELFLLNEITQNLLFKEARRVFGRIIKIEVGYETIESFEKDWDCLHEFISYEKNPDRNFVEFVYQERCGDYEEKWASIPFELLFDDNAVNTYILEREERQKQKKLELAEKEKKEKEMNKESRHKLYEELKAEFEKD